jgi:hypothetical protein
LGNDIDVANPFGAGEDGVVVDPLGIEADDSPELSEQIEI